MTVTSVPEIRSLYVPSSPALPIAAADRLPRDSCEMQTFGPQQSLKFAVPAPQAASDPPGHSLGFSLCSSSPSLQGELPVTDPSNLPSSPRNFAPSPCPAHAGSAGHSLTNPTAPLAAPKVGSDLPCLLTSHLLLNWLHVN